MKDLIFYSIIFIVIYLFYLIFVILRKKKLDKFKKNTYVIYLERMYNLDLSKCNMKILANIIALSNSLIITFTLIIISNIDNLLLKMVLAFAILIPFQLFIYYIIGKIYQKKYKK